MKLTNVGAFNEINPFIEDKLERFSHCEKNFENLYREMFSESANIMSEITDGFKIKKLTYGECEKRIGEISSILASLLSSVEPGERIGIYMDNSIEWIQIFWASLRCGYNPMLLNARLPKSTLDEVITRHSVMAVITDSEKEFPVYTVRLSSILSAEPCVTVKREFGKEVIFMSSGSSENIKLCAYTAENFYYQILDSYNIVKVCPQMKKHYEGELKQLCLLPFYHVFGFIAVYLWFGFFQRTFVFLKDPSPRTLLATIKKHKVTHIFAVPLVWEKVYKEAIKTIRRRGEKTYKKFCRALKFVNGHGALGSFLSKRAFKEVRDGLFGESICFLISGGSSVSREVLEFFNGIGYHIANGYGMTEIGITSVEISTKRKIRNLASVGSPFGYTEYSLGNEGELLVRGKTMASKITVGDKTVITNFDSYFETGDLAKEEKGRYYILGRGDDLVIGEGGENLNPEILEKEFMLPDVKDACLIPGKDNEPTLILTVKRWITSEGVKSLEEEISKKLTSQNIAGLIKNIILTKTPIMLEGEFKKSRKKIRSRYISGEFVRISVDKATDTAESLISSKIAELFATALGKEGMEISQTSDFFLDLGATSLDYFSLIELISEEFEIDTETLRGYGATTVSAFLEKLSGENGL